MRTAIYARVSTEGQEKQETINSQLADLRNYASQNNMVIVEEYVDNGYSGELFDRPALDKLRDDAKNRLFSALLAHSPDRLSRKFIHSGLIQEEFKKWGIIIIFLNRPDAKDTPEDHLLNTDFHRILSVIIISAYSKEIINSIKQLPPFNPK
jgi:site-specific DNA recombinase